MSKKQSVLTPRILFMLLVFVILLPLLPLIISGRWNWWEAWVFAAVSILGFVISRFLAGQRNPELLAERGQYLEHPNPESWDQLLSPLLAFGSGTIPLAAGLNARFGSSADFNLVVKMLAILILLLGYGLGTYALMENRFFSGMVRLQTERGHQVINTGPYRWVRHPGYAGTFISSLAAPFLLDSWWAFVPVLLIFIVIIIRTRLEDRFLQESLEGYRDYAHLVRYRLFPGVW